MIEYGRVKVEWPAEEPLTKDEIYDLFVQIVKRTDLAEDEIEATLYNAIDEVIEEETKAREENGNSFPF